MRTAKSSEEKESIPSHTTIDSTISGPIGNRNSVVIRCRTHLETQIHEEKRIDSQLLQQLNTPGTWRSNYESNAEQQQTEKYFSRAEMHEACA